MRSKCATFVVLLALTVVTLSGCSQIRIAEVPEKAAASESVSGARPDHDLSVLAAEINPPLSEAMSVDQVLSVQLSVAVENLGNSPERDVIVEGWLRPGNNKDGAALLSSKTIIPYIAPGEVRVARLSASGPVSILSSYSVSVSVRPVAQERYLGNNSREYEVTLPNNTNR